MEQQTGKTARDFVAALNRRDPVAAVAIAWSLIESRATLGDQWRPVAQFAATRGEWSLAIAAMERFVAVDRLQAERQLALADMLAQAGRLHEAVAILKPLSARMRRDPRPPHFLGTAYAELGDAGAAVAQLRLALAAAPTGMSWITLAGAKRFAPGDADLAALRAAEPLFANQPASERAPFLYALGKACDDVGEHERAFAAFAEGAALVHAERRYDAAADRAAAQAIIRGLDQQRPAESNAEPDHRDRPIFVTGVPRSGTTLVEQILTSHSKVIDGGELNILRLAVENAGTAGDGTAIRAHYMHLVAERFREPGRIVDKSLNTSRLADHIRRAMPGAPIVWLRRDPLDNAWSCFRTYFSRGVPWSFALEEIGAYFAIEDLLFEHWRDALGDQLLAVPYEALVADGPTWIPRILDHCGLAPEPGVFDFHKSERAVRTASVAQVRQPLHGGAVAASAAYAHHLAPFVEAYARGRSELGLSAQPT